METMTSANRTDSEYVDYLNPTPYSWKRPEGPTRIWRVVEGRRKTADGEVPRFSIQEVPEELENDVMDFMAKYFIVEEPTCVEMGLARDPIAVREIRTLWRNVLNQGVSVIALTVNSDLTAKPVIAGVNILYLESAEDDTDSVMQFRTEAMKKIIGVVFNLSQELDVLKIYGVDKYLGGLGLSVHPSLRGQGIGEELLRAREDIGIAYQIPASETVFTANVSQILAARVGYEVLLERKYSELLDEEGKVAFPGVTVEFIKVMGKRLCTAKTEINN